MFERSIEVFFLQFLLLKYPFSFTGSAYNSVLTFGLVANSLLTWQDASSYCSVLTVLNEKSSMAKWLLSMFRFTFLHARTYRRTRGTGLMYALGCRLMPGWSVHGCGNRVLFESEYERVCSMAGELARLSEILDWCGGARGMTERLNDIFWYWCRSVIFLMV